MAGKTHAELAADFKNHLAERGQVAFVERVRKTFGPTRSYTFIGPQNAPSYTNISGWHLDQQIEAYLRSVGIAKQKRYVEEIRQLFVKALNHTDLCESDVLLRENDDRTFTHVPNFGSMFGNPQQAFYFTITGPAFVNPPSDRMSQDELKAWLRPLKASGYKVEARNLAGTLLPLVLD